MSTEFITTNNQHWYQSKTIEGVYYPSVTTVIGGAFPKGEGFNRYLANQPSWSASQEVLQVAGKRGTNVHQGSEKLEKGEVLKKEFFSVDEWRLLEGFVKWHHATNPQVIAIEESVVSDELKVGGTIDRVYVIDGVVTLLDIKTSGAIHPNYWAQTAAYVRLWNEKHQDCLIEQTAILRVTTKRKSGYEYAVHTSEEIEQDYNTFLAVKCVWDYLNPNAKPTIIEVPDTLKI